MPNSGRIKLGERQTSKPATRHPSMMDIAWAAGIFEGEGHITNKNRTEMVVIVQKDPYILERLAELFGGPVLYGKKYPLCRWQIYGPRARGFAQTVFSFLSPRRKNQVLKALGHAKTV